MSDKTELTLPETGLKRVLIGANWMNILGRFLALILVFAFFAIAVEGGKFYSLRNLENILRQSCVFATAGLGMTMVIIAAGIDLSAGSMIALSVVVVAWVLNLNGTGADGQPLSLLTSHPALMPVLAVLAGVLTSTLTGLANGAMVVGLRLVPFIVTLGTMGMIRGLAKGIAHEKDIYPERTWINTIMDPSLSNPERRWMIFPIGVWILLAGVIVASFLLRYARLGRHIFAVGSNEQTARLCGVPVERTKLFIYTASGFFCGVAGLMQFSYIGGIGQPTTGVMYELSVIAAVIIGGASFTGGEGSILGTLIGALTLTMLSMGGKQMGWPQWVQEMVLSGILIAVVALDRWRHHKAT
jgi:ribose transport system permease protein/erythritol transport system permease protein